MSGTNQPPGPQFWSLLVNPWDPKLAKIGIQPYGALSGVLLLHTLYVYCAMTLLLALIVYTFLLILLLRTVSPALRRVTFDPSMRNSTHTPTWPVAPPPPPPPHKNKPAPPLIPPRTAWLLSLSLTITPCELKLPTPVVTEDPLRALGRICAFLVSNTVRAYSVKSSA
jgi:hypothetical protein